MSCSGPTVLALLFSTAGIMRTGADLSLQPCPLQAEENKSTTVTCSGISISDKVIWSAKAGTPAGVCDPVRCQPLFNNTFGLSRPSLTVSKMTYNSVTRAFNMESVQCVTESASGTKTGSAHCDIDVIYPAEVSSCTLSPLKSDTTWTVQGTCIINKVFSSRNKYFCYLQHGNSGDPSVSLYNPTFSDNYASGECIYNASFPKQSGTYTYKVFVFPGNTSQDAGIITVAAPSVNPIIKCLHSGVQHIPENTTLNCTCTSSDLGNPQGRLTGYRDNVLLPYRGNYGDGDLKLPPQTLSRKNVGTVLKCVLDWVTANSGYMSGNYTASVAYGPDSVTVQGNRTFYTDTTGSLDLRLTCQPHEVRPMSGLVYKWANRCVDVTSSTCTFRPHPPNVNDNGDVHASVTCTVINPSNNNISAEGLFKLDLKYPPRKPQISGYSDGVVLHQDDSLTLTCTVTGGDPIVDSVNLTCAGHTSNVTLGQSSSVWISSLSASDHGMTCMCSGQWAVLDYYTLTDTRTLTVYYGPVQPVVKLNNIEGNLTVSERNMVVLTCLTNGRPTPNMTLDKAGTGQVLFEQASWLNHTLDNLQCQNAGNYTCTARSDAGTQKTTVELLVNCRPRRVSVSEPIPHVNYVNQSVHLTFQLLAYPLPTNSSFVYLGKTLNTSRPGMAASNILLGSKCWVSGNVYDVSCDVTVDNATEESAGYYKIVITNEYGADSFPFEVKFNDSHVTDREEYVFPVGAAVGGGLAAAAVVVAVVLFLKCRGSKQAGKRCLERKTDGRTHKETGAGTMILNNLYGTAEDKGACESKTSTSQRSARDNVDLQAHVDHVQHKPVAKTSYAKDEKETYSVVNKGNTLVSNPAVTAEYTNVDKSKTAKVCGQDGEAAIKTGTAAKNKSKPIPKPAKKPKPAQSKYKGKAKEERKEGAVCGNMLLSMDPIDDKVYENFGFQNEESETKLRDPPKGPAADQHSANKDVLVYTTIQFTESQQKAGEHTPPTRETTEYASIAFHKQPSISNN